MYKGLEHTAIASPNPRLLADWYASHLEFVINYEYDGNFFVRAQNGTMLEIIPSAGEPFETKMQTPGIRHLAIDVDNFDLALADLKAKKVSFVGDPIEKKGNRLAFFEDLDGNLVHIIQRAQPLP